MNKNRRDEIRRALKALNDQAENPDQELQAIHVVFPNGEEWDLLLPVDLVRIAALAAETKGISLAEWVGKAIYEKVMEDQASGAGSG